MQTQKKKNYFIRKTNIPLPVDLNSSLVFWQFQSSRPDGYLIHLLSDIIIRKRKKNELRKQQELNIKFLCFETDPLQNAEGQQLIQCSRFENDHFLVKDNVTSVNEI